MFSVDSHPWRVSFGLLPVRCCANCFDRKTCGSAACECFHSSFKSAKKSCAHLGPYHHVTFGLACFARPDVSQVHYSNNIFVEVSRSIPEAQAWHDFGDCDYLLCDYLLCVMHAYSVSAFPALNFVSRCNASMCQYVLACLI